MVIQSGSSEYLICPAIGTCPTGRWELKGPSSRGSGSTVAIASGRSSRVIGCAPAGIVAVISPSPCFCAHFPSGHSSRLRPEARPASRMPCISTKSLSRARSTSEYLASHAAWMGVPRMPSGSIE